MKLTLWLVEWKDEVAIWIAAPNIKASRRFGSFGKNLNGPARMPGVTKFCALPSFGPPLNKVALSSISTQACLAMWYWALVFEAIERPSVSACSVGMVAPKQEVILNFPKPFPAATLGNGRVRGAVFMVAGRHRCIDERTDDVIALFFGP